MTTDEIERRLRYAAPDEPATLPPLLLPLQIGTEPVSERSIDLRLGRRRRSMPLAGVAAVAIGALVANSLVARRPRAAERDDASPSEIELREAA